MRPNLTPLPARMRHLPLDERGYPVPWFVAWIDGAPEFRASDPRKFVAAIREKRCWVCGGTMGVHKTFVIGPMCGVNRSTAEPPCHYHCAIWSAINCPFLSNAKMVRNEKGLDDYKNPGGIMIKRNPGVVLLWTTRSFNLRNVDNGVLIEIGEPSAILFFKDGRRATREEVGHAVASGLPLLQDMASQEDRERGNDNSSKLLRAEMDRFNVLVEAYA